MSRGEWRRGVSLEYKLPLFITALLVATMAAGMLFAYAHVKNAAIDNVRARLENLTQDLADLLEPASAQRLQLLREIAGSDPVMAYLDSPSELEEKSVRAELEPLRLGNQPDDRIFLLDAADTPVFEIDSRPAPGADSAVPVEYLTDSGFSPLFTIESAVFYWVSTPIVVGERRVGRLAELRRVGGTGDASPFEALIGEDAVVLFGNASPGGTWVSLDGDPIPPLDIAPFTGSAQYEAADGSLHFLHAQPIPGFPWHVIARSPASTVLARPNAFLRQATIVGILLSLLGALVAWMISRRITLPLKALRLASEAIAKGDYDRRVDLQRRDEMGILADAYNHMAARVQTSHQELTSQYQMANELAAELERAGRAKSEFLATMSHEIRTPINAIIGYTDLLSLGIEGELNEAQAGQLDRIRASGRHLVNLVDQVLDLARVESGRLGVEVETAYVATSVETMLTVSRPLAAAKEITIADECTGATDLRYEGDPQRVDQILVNLVSNAIKFTEPGGRITVRCANRVADLPFDGTGGRWACISIDDTGIGIDPEHLETVFEPFMQVESGYTRRHGGAGLGLAISLRLARSMGGDLTVESTPGRGSTFTLWLPAAAALEELSPAGPGDLLDRVSTEGEI